MSTAIHLTTHGGPSRLAAASALHAQNFLDDPVILYLLHTTPEAKRRTCIPALMHVILKTAALNGAFFDEAWTARTPQPEHGQAADATPPAAAALWLPPGKNVDNPLFYIPAGMVGVLRRVGLSAAGRMIFGYQNQVKAAKRKHLARADGKGMREYYYLNLISTRVDERGQGLSSAIIRRLQEKIRDEGIERYIWLEATTERSMRLYRKLGFEIVEEWVLGKGDVNARGLEENGGEGVKLWGMLWKPSQ